MGRKEKEGVGQKKNGRKQDYKDIEKGMRGRG